MNQKITERNFTEFGWITLFFKLMHNILRFFLRKFGSPLKGCFLINEARHLYFFFGFGAAY
jgi:hypothetical protein